MVYRNNAGRLGAGFISVCLKTRWLGPKRGFYVLECHCKLKKKIDYSSLSIPGNTIYFFLSGGDWCFPMGVQTEGIPRVCQGDLGIFIMCLGVTEELISPRHHLE